LVITKSKPLEEILKALGEIRNIFLIGCGGCATYCKTGGEDEVWLLDEKLAEYGKHTVGYTIVDMVCHSLLLRKELRTHSEEIKHAQGIIVLACGTGVQLVSENLRDKKVIPGLDTLFLGAIRRYGDFVEYCKLCGECLLDKTGGICPVAQCPKHMLNGPCGGVSNGMCEINSDLECVWVKIFKICGKDVLSALRGPINFENQAHVGHVKI